MANWKELLAQFLPKVVEILQKKTEEEVAKPVKSVTVEITPEPAKPVILDWENPKSKINSRFTVHETTWLPSWSVYHKPTDEQKKAIIALADAVSKITDDLEKQLDRKLPINVHAWMRPDKAICPGSEWDGKDYNRYIYETQVWKDLTPEEKAKKTVPLSPHRTGNAIDFHYLTLEGNIGCDMARQLLVPLLEKHGLRMENISANKTRTWVHLDSLPVKINRYFIP